MIIKLPIFSKFTLDINSKTYQFPFYGSQKISWFSGFTVVGLYHNIFAILFSLSTPIIPEPTEEDCRNNLELIKSLEINDSVNAPSTCFDKSGEPLIEELKGVEPGERINVTKNSIKPVN